MSDARHRRKGARLECETACHDGTFGAVVTAFNSVLGQIRCACGSEQFRLHRRLDGSALVACTECCIEVAEIVADVVGCE